jgi:hypothetical protein
VPKRKGPPLSQKDQSERFRAAVRELIEAGELDPTEADAAFERMMDRVKVEKSAS